MITKIISGGQSGADLGGLDAAREMGVKTGGNMPKNFYTEDGSKPEYEEKYGMTELPFRSYNERTKLNIQESDVTLIFSPNPTSPGTLSTIKFCKQLQKPYFLCDKSKEFSANLINMFNFLWEHRPSVINVAGNRESVSPGIYAYTLDMMMRLIQLYTAYLPEMNEIMEEYEKIKRVMDDVESCQIVHEDELWSST